MDLQLPVIWSATELKCPGAKCGGTTLGGDRGRNCVHSLHVHNGH